MIEQSFLVPTTSEQQLRVQRITSNPAAPAVLLLHGLFESGDIFYQQTTRKGLAYFLAQQGFDTFTPDLRGRGCSWPGLTPNVEYSTYHVVNEDLVRVIAAIERLKKSNLAYWVAHAWGGVLINCLLARFPHFADHLKGLIYFGSYRRTDRTRFTDFLNLALLGRFKGFIPRNSPGGGVCDEFVGLYNDYCHWSKSSDWLDPIDGYDYGAALKQLLKRPASLYFAGQDEVIYGSRGDVRRFMRELGPHDGRLIPIGMSAGNLRDYTHLEMLSHRDAVHDLFPFVVNWMHEVGSTRALKPSSKHDSSTVVGSVVERQAVE